MLLIDDVWVCNLIQNIARYVFKSGKWFEAGHWIAANGPIKSESSTRIVGLAFAHDPQMPQIQTPHGKVDFLQMFGITQEELDVLGKSANSTLALLERHKKNNPLLITDLDAAK